MRLEPLCTTCQATWEGNGVDGWFAQALWRDVRRLPAALQRMPQESGIELAPKGWTSLTGLGAALRRLPVWATFTEDEVLQMVAVHPKRRHAWTATGSGRCTGSPRPDAARWDRPGSRRPLPRRHHRRGEGREPAR